MRRNYTKEKKLIIKKISKNGSTANEVINKVWLADLKNGADWVVENRGWKYYAHLNKLFTPMGKLGLINKVGEKIGPTGRKEVVWAKK